MNKKNCFSDRFPYHYLVTTSLQLPHLVRIDGLAARQNAVPLYVSMGMNSH